MEQQGWISLHRKILSHPIAKKPEYLALWLHLLLMANHEPQSFIFNNVKKTCQRGQLITGRERLATNTGICQSNVERILKFLENEHQIEQQTTNKFRLITILNYNSYQRSGQQNGQQQDNNRTTTGQPADTNNNENNYNNENNQFLSEIEPTAEEEKKEIIAESHEIGDREQRIAGEQGPPRQEVPPRRSLFKQLDYFNAGVFASSVEEKTPDPPAPSSTPSPPVYGKVEISNMIAAIKQKVRISDFVDSKIERNMAKHCVGLMRKIGKEEFVRRLDYLLADTFHSKNCNKIKYIYNNIKGFIEPIPHVI